MGFDFIIFDLDGTIVDSQKDITSAVNLVRQEFGFEPLSPEKVCSFLGSGVKALVDRVVPEKSEEINRKALERFKFHYGQCLTDTTVVYDGIKETLEILKAKKMAVLSNKTEIFSCEIIKRLGLAKYFVEIWGGDTAGVKKPDPKPVFDLVKKTRSELKNTVMIGDSDNDFKVAKAADIASIAVLYGYSTKEQISKFSPDYMVAKPQDIIKIVR